MSRPRVFFVGYYDNIINHRNLTIEKAKLIRFIYIEIESLNKNYLIKFELLLDMDIDYIEYTKFVLAGRNGTIRLVNSEKYGVISELTLEDDFFKWKCEGLNYEFNLKVVINDYLNGILNEFLELLMIYEKFMNVQVEGTNVQFKTHKTIIEDDESAIPYKEPDVYLYGVNREKIDSSSNEPDWNSIRDIIFEFEIFSGTSYLSINTSLGNQDELRIIENELNDTRKLSCLLANKNNGMVNLGDYSGVNYVVSIKNNRFVLACDECNTMNNRINRITYSHEIDELFRNKLDQFVNLLEKYRYFLFKKRAHLKMKESPKPIGMFDLLKNELTLTICFRIHRQMLKKSLTNRSYSENFELIQKKYNVCINECVDYIFFMYNENKSLDVLSYLLSNNRITKESSKFFWEDLVEYIKIFIEDGLFD